MNGYLEGQDEVTCVNKLIDNYGPMECFGIWKKEGLFFSILGKNISDLINFSSEVLLYSSYHGSCI